MNTGTEDGELFVVGSDSFKAFFFHPRGVRTGRESVLCFRMTTAMF